MNLTTLKKFSTPEISDALDACGVEGALLGIKPIKPGMRFVGPAYTVKYRPYTEKPKDFKGAGNYIDQVPEGAVVVVDNNGSHDCTTWGDILTQVAIMKNLGGTVVNGSVRDISFIREHNYPVFSKHVYMRSGKNRVYKSQDQCPVTIARITINPGDIVMGDDNGVVVIPEHLLSETIRKAQSIQQTENCIIDSVKSGITLEEARKKHGYDQPWVKKADE